MHRGGRLAGAGSRTVLNVRRRPLSGKFRKVQGTELRVNLQLARQHANGCNIHAGIDLMVLP
jgi:hypothetical protein